VLDLRIYKGANILTNFNYNLKPIYLQRQKISDMAEILKSPADDRLYKYFKLDNGMRCLIIEDPEADKCAASLDVGVGSSLDPKPLYGTAHFLEHMLF